MEVYTKKFGVKRSAYRRWNSDLESPSVRCFRTSRNLVHPEIIGLELVVRGSVQRERKMLRSESELRRIAQRRQRSDQMSLKFVGVIIEDGEEINSDSGVCGIAQRTLRSVHERV